MSLARSPTSGPPEFACDRCNIVQKGENVLNAPSGWALVREMNVPIRHYCNACVSLFLTEDPTRRLRDQLTEARIECRVLRRMLREARDGTFDDQPDDVD